VERRTGSGCALYKRVGRSFKAFACFAYLTAIISRGGLGAAAYPGGWVLAWLEIGAITLATWVAALLSAGFVQALVLA
jgi:hypothetical protein